MLYLPTVGHPLAECAQRIADRAIARQLDRELNFNTRANQFELLDRAGKPAPTGKDLRKILKDRERRLWDK